MGAKLLEHVNVRTTRLEETVRFYVDVLGLRRGHYPGKVVPGAWIYDTQDVPIFHLVAIDPFDTEVQAKADAATVMRPLSSLSGTGAIDHVALEADDYDGMLDRIRAAGLPNRPRHVLPELRQIYVFDPNGILIELNFRAAPETH